MLMIDSAKMETTWIQSIKFMGKLRLKSEERASCSIRSSQRIVESMALKSVTRKFLNLTVWTSNYAFESWTKGLDSFIQQTCINPFSFSKNCLSSYLSYKLWLITSFILKIILWYLRLLINATFKYHHYSGGFVVILLK